MKTRQDLRRDGGGLENLALAIHLLQPRREVRQRLQLEALFRCFDEHQNRRRGEEGEEEEEEEEENAPAT